MHSYADEPFAQPEAFHKRIPTCSAYMHDELMTDRFFFISALDNIRRLCRITCINDTTIILSRNYILDVFCYLRFVPCFPICSATENASDYAV